MSNQLVDDYIKQSRQADISDSEIKRRLLESGWGNDVVSEAFMNPAGSSNVAGKPRKDYWNSTYKNFLHFSYLGYFIFSLPFTMLQVYHDGDEYHPCQSGSRDYHIL